MYSILPSKSEWLMIPVMLVMLIGVAIFFHWTGHEHERETFQQAKKEWITERENRGIINAPPGSIFIDRDKVNLYLCENVNGFGDNIGCVQCHTPRHGG